MRLHRIGSCLLLLLCAASALAEPGGYRRDARDAVRAYHIQAVTLERTLPPGQMQGVPQERPRQGMPDSSGYGAPRESRSDSQQAENARRQQGRMTPEERRTLRRQIDEAGHDIYSPRR
ncbi:hypothetical protein [Noviherbaspirillum denitrificans]|uniref:hypothetical protein n=1 Tax=Noviherbaspirillum denitrificans TaxID=1968433 RepID=UPI000B534996|nr:hypothetical protein [Noviherbaspirillum denitrificans]